MAAPNADTSRNWCDALKLADQAAVPSETFLESPEMCESDPNKRMPTLSVEESTDFTCFEARLVNPNINSEQVKLSCLKRVFSSTA
jgi:hypothetical protein